MLWLFKSILAFYVIGFCLGGIYKLLYAERPISWADVANPFKWFSLLISAVFISLIPEHVIEQMVLRLYDDECKGCKAQGYCSDCGCAMPEKAFDPAASCSKGNWGPMILRKKAYKEFRKQFPITIKVTYEQQ